MQLVPTYHNKHESRRSYTFKFLYYGGYEHALPTKFDPLRIYDHRPWSWEIPRDDYTRITKNEVN